MPPKQLSAAAAIAACQELMATKLDGITGMFVESFNKLDGTIELIRMDMYVMDDRLEKLQEQLNSFRNDRQMLSNVTAASSSLPDSTATDWIPKPLDTSGSNEKLTKYHLNEFVQKYGGMNDEVDIKAKLKEVEKLVRWACDDEATSIFTHSNDDEPTTKLPTWKKLNKKHKQIIIQVVSDEVEKRGLPVKQCASNWFVEYLSHQCWKNKAKYHNKKVKIIKGNSDKSM